MMCWVLSEFDCFVGSIEDVMLIIVVMVMVVESMGFGSVVFGLINNDM